jgi:transforming growth factor-beta-induced protein
MNKKTIILGLAVILSLSILSSCEKDEDESKTAAEMSIAEYASSDANFSTLVAALTRADLAGTLDGTGNFTVFAPTNAAFDQLFSDLGVSGIDDIPVETLESVLLYHVLGEEKKSGMLQTGYFNTLSPAFNGFLSLYLNLASGVSLNKNTSVTAADVDVNNGVIHVIDKVLMPPTVVDHALANDNFSTLVEAVVKAGLADALSAEGPYTIFAPTNAAFQELFTQLGVSGIGDLTAEQLTPILTYHVVEGNIRSTDLSAGTVPTLNGDITIALSPSPSINSTSQIIATDVQASNGVIHVIDEVLIP